MRARNHTLDRRRVHRAAAQHLQAHLQFKDYKRKTTARVLWSLLLAAAARITSLSDACQRLRDAPSDETARESCWRRSPTTPHCNGDSTPRWPGTCPRHCTSTPAAGHRSDADPLPRQTLLRPQRDLPRTGPGRHQPLPRLCHRLRRPPGAAVRRRPDRRPQGRVAQGCHQRLLRQAASVGIRPRLLLLDRGFYSVAVIRYLQQARVPFLMPVVCHGRSPKQRGGPTGSHVFRTWKKSGWSRYTLTEARTGRTATVPICVKCRNYRGQWKRHGRQALVYAYWGYRPPSPEAVFATYRLRFGIESSYRQMHEGRIRTTTRRPEVRLLYAGIALVLRNLWVWLHYTVLARPRRGGRVILLERLRWETLLLWLLHVAEETFGVTDTTFTERAMPYELAG